MVRPAGSSAAYGKVPKNDCPAKQAASFSLVFQPCRYRNRGEIKIQIQLFIKSTAEVTLIPKNGDSTTASVSKYLNILQEQPNGEWKTTRDSWNGNQ